jgi:predicted membrane protein
MQVLLIQSYDFDSAQKQNPVIARNMEYSHCQERSNLISTPYFLFLHSLFYTLFSIFFSLYSLFYALFSILFSLCSFLYTLYSMLYTLYSFSSNPNLNEKQRPTLQRHLRNMRLLKIASNAKPKTNNS